MYIFKKVAITTSMKEKRRGLRDPYPVVLIEIRGRKKSISFLWMTKQRSCEISSSLFIFLLFLFSSFFFCSSPYFHISDFNVILLYSMIIKESKADNIGVHGQSIIYWQQWGSLERYYSYSQYAGHSFQQCTNTLIVKSNNKQHQQGRGGEGDTSSNKKQ